MKKAVLLFALSFVLVTFLNAQNDCTGSVYNDAPKSKSEKPVNYNDTNQGSSTDCVKPGNTDDVDDFYQLNRFGELMNHRQEKSSVANSQQRSKTNYNLNLSNSFSQSGTIVCCIPPPDDHELYDSVINK